jgi:hypothetical protein
MATVTRRTEVRTRAPIFSSLSRHMPGGPPVGADLLHEFVEPDVRGLERFVENIEDLSRS